MDKKNIILHLSCNGGCHTIPYTGSHAIPYNHWLNSGPTSETLARNSAKQSPPPPMATAIAFVMARAVASLPWFWDRLNGAVKTEKPRQLCLRKKGHIYDKWIPCILWCTLRFVFLWIKWRELLNEHWWHKGIFIHLMNNQYYCCWISIDAKVMHYVYIIPYTATLNNLNFHPLEWM